MSLMVITTLLVAGSMTCTSSPALLVWKIRTEPAASGRATRRDRQNRFMGASPRWDSITASNARIVPNRDAPTRDIPPDPYRAATVRERTDARDSAYVAVPRVTGATVEKRCVE